ncbi:energy transducer TonB [Sphingobium lignivorans]|uniref:Protein TonB n=1 Tax=Sphingobium lignivorans TaxID=2735886 RepID=A0ABR6NG95_9SPHN|nr:energy transducer TonB [Sphingobium lignivorans]MBB5985523.1 protein TonB [Sphingobium lignivorans]
MNRKSSDLLNALGGVIAIATLLAFAWSHVPVDGLTRRAGRVVHLAVQDLTIDLGMAGSAITPGPPPVIILPPGSKAPRGRGPATWITNDDYPMEALRNEQSGVSHIAWTIETDGRAGQCHVVRASAHAALDEAACRLILRNGRYEPARDAQGRAIRAVDQRRVVWRLAD